MSNKKAFTLVEIMIVVVILGLLAAMAIPAFRQIQKNRRLRAEGIGVLTVVEEPREATTYEIDGPVYLNKYPNGDMVLIYTDRDGIKHGLSISDVRKVDAKRFPVAASSDEPISVER